MIKFISLIFFFLYQLFFFSGSQTLIAHELAIIQKVSKTRQNFIVNIGKEKGIAVEQVCSFNNTQVAFLAKAIVVTREYSVWEVLSAGMGVPFQKNEIVNINYNPESLWFQDPKAKNTGALSSISAEYNGRVSSQDGKRRSISDFSFAIFGSYLTEVSESISSVPAYDDRSRNGFTGDALIHWRAFRELYLGIGGRYHREVSETSVYISRTSRFMLLVDAIYHFRNFSLSKSHLYFGTRIGAGITKTKIPKMVFKGESYLLPALMTGVEWVISPMAAINLGISLETMKSSEKFESRVISNDNIEKQIVSQVNLLGVIGIKAYL